MVSLVNTTLHLRKKETPVIQELFQVIEEEWKLPSLFCMENVITLIPKPDKYITRKENYRPTSLMNIGHKILQLSKTKF